MNKKEILKKIEENNRERRQAYKEFQEHSKEFDRKFKEIMAAL